MNIKIPSYAVKILEKLNSFGYQAYIVGGCIRDSILKRNPNDWDITTNATPEQMLTVFKGYNVIPTGIKHGTLTVISEKKPIEITTFRTDGEYENHRKPKEVCFVGSLKEDLARRDFTCNAIACDKDGNIFDYFGGIEDIENKTIKAVGEPKKRFDEDALRILRAVRFASQLGFSIEENTAKSAFLQKDFLKEVSAERHFAEFKKLIMGKFAGKILQEFKDITAVFLAGADNFKNAELFDRMPLDLPLRLAVLAYFCSDNPQIITDWCNALKCDKKTMKSAQDIRNLLAGGVPQNSIELKKIISAYDFEISEKYLEVLSVLGKNSVAEIFESYKQNPPCLFIKDLNISSKTLAEMGLKGADFGKAQKLCLKLVIEEQVENSEQALVQIVRENFNG